MEKVQLNLSRKWRSKQFDQIVGQQLSVRILKNSLYRDHYFPVYLFSGQKGCGKTTTARVFAAAINCEALTAFQKDPRTQVVPCLTCPSCVAMSVGKHPDFIEIDAASHTGVDNVRQIIEASSLLPLMGRKKIYLIDEAHMLSKAAFNAFLKILEEPPASVLFILATTDPQKIISTVTSRCFRLLFTPIEEKPLSAHLQHICKAEGIAYEDEALQIIVKQTEGSARDALNLLEQVRFSSPRVTKQAVYALLGTVDDERMLQLFDAIVNKMPQELLTCMQELQLQTCAPDVVWEKLLICVRTGIWLKHGVVPRVHEVDTQALTAIIQNCSVERLTDMLLLLYDNEEIFIKTTAQHTFLEMLCLQLCHPRSVEVKKTVTASQPNATEQEKVVEKPSVTNTAWASFLGKITAVKDPLVTSIFQQGRFVKFDQGTLEVAFTKDHQFFTEWLTDSEKVWQPLLHEAFGGTVVLVPQFTDAAAAKKPVFKPTAPVGAQQQRRPSAKEAPVDVSDKEKWQKTNALLDSFGGTVSEIQDDGA